MEHYPEQDPEQLSPQEQQELEDRRKVQACLHSEGFQLLQDLWATQVRGYRELLTRVEEPPDKLRFYQGAIRAWADFKTIIEGFLEKEAREEEHEG